MKITLAIPVLFVCLHLTAGETEKGDPQAQWIRHRYEQLSTRDADTVPKIELKEYSQKDGGYLYFPSADGGIIFFSDEEWIMITQSSAHYEKSGDVTMIRTSKGEYYLNYGHCCKTMIIDSKIKIESLKDFLSSTGKGAEGKPTTWIKFENHEKD